MENIIYKNRPELTANAGLSYVAWQLSRRGWRVSPTIRDARGTDMLVTSLKKDKIFSVQSKALSKRHAVSLGLDLTILRSEWWVVTVHANTDNPICYILTLDEVRSLASQDKGGAQAYWLEARDYDCEMFKNAWDLIGLGVV